MSSSQSFPNPQKLSILTATVLLAFAVARFINLPSSEFTLDFAGVFFTLQVNINTFIALIVAGLTASGTDWILRDHPKLSKSPSLKHWLVPGLTAWVLSLPLSYLSDRLLWWIGFFAAGVIILIVIIAEYFSADPDDIRHPFATTVLVSISFMLFLIFLISLRSVGLRLIFILPAVSFASLLVCLRVINFRLHSTWLLPQAFAISILVAQVAASLHYLPISPITFGLIVFGLAYSLINFIVIYHQSSLIRVAALESSFFLSITTVVAFLF